MEEEEVAKGCLEAGLRLGRCRFRYGNDGDGEEVLRVIRIIWSHVTSGCGFGTGKKYVRDKLKCRVDEVCWGSSNLVAFIIYGHNRQDRAL